MAPNTQRCLSFFFARYRSVCRPFKSAERVRAERAREWVRDRERGRESEREREILGRLGDGRACLSHSAISTYARSVQNERIARRSARAMLPIVCVRACDTLSTLSVCLTAFFCSHSLGLSPFDSLTL